MKHALSTRLAVVAALVVCIVAGGLLHLDRVGAEPQQRSDLPVSLAKIFETYCTSCHGDRDEAGTGMDFRRHETLVSGELPVVVVGKGSESELYRRLTSQDQPMPPEGQTQRPTKQEIAAIRNWIDGGAPTAVGAAALPSSAEAGQKVIQAHCVQCHSAESPAKNLDLSNAGSYRRVLEGELLRRITLPADAPGRMPRAPNRPLNEGQVAAVRVWQEAERKRLAGGTRVSPRQVLELIHADLRALPEERRGVTRYIDLRAIYSTPGISRAELALAQAAVSKVIASLSWANQVTAPRPLGEGSLRGVVLALDTSRYDGSTSRGARRVRFLDQWSRVLAPADPYAVTYRYGRDDEVAQVAKEISEMSGTDVPALRGDWLIARAARAPLYYDVLALPDTMEAFEHMLGVDSRANLLETVREGGSPLALRSGFGAGRSGVSINNRLVERHGLPGGYYWKSYDFGQPTREVKRLLENPLGPKGAHLAPHPGRFEFEEDGGEMIFTLPNGLQAYFLTDARGRRINEGPIRVVRDRQQQSGHPEIYAGYSCMICHSDGMEPLKDEVREAARGFGREVRERVARLYPPRPEMDAVVLRDRDHYRRSVAPALSPFLDVPAVGQPWPEPVALMVRRYNQPLTVADVVRELGANPKEFAADRFQLMASGNEDVRLLIRSLLASKVIGREQFEAIVEGKPYTQFQLLVRAAGLAVPVRR